MSSSSKHALPEHWTELQAARTHAKQCAEEILAIKRSCAAEHGKRQISECPECFSQALDRMRVRYCESKDREWFSQRTAFLIELETLFTDVKDKKIDLNSIETSIESEKEAWYRWVLRTYPLFLTASGDGADQHEVKDMLNDPDRSRDELVDKVWGVVGKPENWSADVESFIEKALAAKGDPRALKQLYISFFFKDKSEQASGGARKYLDVYESNENMTVEEVIDRIARDHNTSVNKQPERDTHLQRLGELQRAKLAFEHKRQQTKSRAQAQAAQTRIADELYDLPPCTVCQKSANPKAIISCSLCQALKQVGTNVSLTVYCSDECYKKGHETHVEKLHDCEAGDKCVQMREEDVDVGEADSVTCNACFDEKKSSIYCSEKCAVANLSQHRRDKHSATTTSSADARTLVSPLQQLLEKTLKQGNPGLKMTFGA